MMSLNFEFKNFDFVMLRNGTWAVFIKDPNTDEGNFLCQDSGYLELADYDENLYCGNGKNSRFDIMVVIRGCKTFTRAHGIALGRVTILKEEILFDRRKCIDFKSLDNTYLVIFRNGEVGKPDPEKEVITTTEDYNLKYDYFDEITGEHSNSSFDIMKIIKINSDYDLQVIFTGKEE